MRLALIAQTQGLILLLNGGVRMDFHELGEMDTSNASIVSKVQPLTPTPPKT